MLHPDTLRVMAHRRNEAAAVMQRHIQPDVARMLDAIDRDAADDIIGVLGATNPMQALAAALLYLDPSEERQREIAFILEEATRGA